MMNKVNEDVYGQAMQNWRHGHLDLALAAMNTLIEQGDGDLGVFYSMRGSINYERKDLRCADTDFQSAVKLKPASRLASALYYNFLVETFNLEKAHLEGLRFLRIVDGRLSLSNDTKTYIDVVFENFIENPDSLKGLPKTDLLMLKRLYQEIHPNQESDVFLSCNEG